MGVFEMPAFAKGTLEIARAVARGDSQGRNIDRRRRRFRRGDSCQPASPTKFRTFRPAAARRWNFWAGRKLPGVEALTDKRNDSGLSAQLQPCAVHFGPGLSLALRPLPGRGAMRRP